MSKFIIRALVIILLIILILATLAVVFINSIAKTAITSAGTSVLGVPTTVSSVDIGIFSGHSELTDLEVQNPKDYPGTFLKLSDGILDVNLGSLLSNSIEVKEIEFDGIDLSFIQKVNGSNVNEILANVKKNTASSNETASKTESTSSGGRKFIIDELKITKVSVAISIEPISSATKPSVVKIKQVVVKDIGKKEGGATTDQIVSIVVQSVIHSVLEAAPGEIPSVMLQGMKGGLSSLGNLDFGDVSFDGGEGFKKITNSISNLGKSSGNKIGDAFDGLGKGISDLIGGDKDKDKDKKSGDASGDTEQQK
ncbi:MAG: hypothetical protein CBC35_08955 [Planctomycetes bacterium TMED75]|nr:hypothetical protein [Planctomycetaceae bacterium]OUU91701.1 MAG: hypothetical protein CBC35_08955 [Planctomycetes bacterium TMED75]